MDPNMRFGKTTIIELEYSQKYWHRGLNYSDITVVCSESQISKERLLEL